MNDGERKAEKILDQIQFARDAQFLRAMNGTSCGNKQVRMIGSVDREGYRKEKKQVKK